MHRRSNKKIRNSRKGRVSHKGRKSHRKFGGPRDYLRKLWKRNYRGLASPKGQAVGAVYGALGSLTGSKYFKNKHIDSKQKAGSKYLNIEYTDSKTGEIKKVNLDDPKARQAAENKYKLLKKSMNPDFSMNRLRPMTDRLKQETQSMVAYNAPAAFGRRKSRKSRKGSKRTRRTRK
jgi:hypothetical protein